MASEKQKEIFIAVVGAGWWSQGWHLPQLNRCENVVISAIVDSNPHPKSNLNPNLEPLGKLKDTYPSAQIFDSVSSLLSETSTVKSLLDGVIVCTPHSTHAAIGKELLLLARERHSKQEKPLHILMEKPMTTDIQEAKELCELVQANKDLGVEGQFYINHSANYRLQAKAAANAMSKIGKLKFIQASFASPLLWLFGDVANRGWNEPTPSSSMLGNGFAWGQSSHILAWIYGVAGPNIQPQRVHCLMQHHEETGADIAHSATIECSDSVLISLSGTTWLPGHAHSHPPVGKEVQISLYGTDGALLYGGTDIQETSGQLQLRRPDGSTEVLVDAFRFENCEPSGQGPESLHAFLRTCRCGNPTDNGNVESPLGADANLGLKTVQTIQAMYQSHASKGAMVDVEF